MLLRGFYDYVIHDMLNSDVSECDEEWFCLFYGAKMLKRGCCYVRRSGTQ